MNLHLPGRATHYFVERRSSKGGIRMVLACGTWIGTALRTYERREVDCRRCRRTRAWRAAGRRP